MSSPIIILKLDDFQAYAFPKPDKPEEKLPEQLNWKRVIDYVEHPRYPGLKISIGLIGQYLEKSYDDSHGLDSEWFFAMIKLFAKNRKRYEIFNHGYTHTDKPSEFLQSIGNQRDSLEKTQKLARTRIEQLAGVKDYVIRSFGAPFNDCTEDTAKIIEESSEIKVWLVPRDRPKCLGGKTKKLRLIMENYEGLEFTESDPRRDKETGLSFRGFQKALDSFHPTREKNYLLCQGHPAAWCEAAFQTFKDIVEYAHERGATFMLPHEYYLDPHHIT